MAIEHQTHHAHLFQQDKPELQQIARRQHAQQAMQEGPLAATPRPSQGANLFMFCLRGGPGAPLSRERGERCLCPGRICCCRSWPLRPRLADGVPASGWADRRSEAVGLPANIFVLFRHKAETEGRISGRDRAREGQREKTSLQATQGLLALSTLQWSALSCGTMFVCKRVLAHLK